MKNILFILPWLPFPLKSGGHQAIFNGIKAIKDHYNVFITFSSEEDMKDSEELSSFIDELDEKITVLPFLIPRPDQKQSIRRKIASLLNKIQRRVYSPQYKSWNPYSYWIEELLPKPKAYIDHVLRIIETHQIDIVQCEMLRNLAFVQSLPQSVKSVFVHHELGFVRHQLELNNVTDKQYDGPAFGQCSRLLEISQLNKYDCVVTLSAIDRQKLSEAGVTTAIHNSFAIVNPLGIKFDGVERSHELFFVGPDSHTPNYIGIRWFLDNCWIPLLQSDPAYHLTVIGKWTSHNINSITSVFPNISFAGFVPDLYEVVKGGTMIVPITVGSGIRMKILEACNMGVPFVSTTVGAEGIPIINGENGFIADSPQHFVNAIASLQDLSIRKKLRNNSQQLIQNHYSMQALSRNRIQIYESLFN